MFAKIQGPILQAFAYPFILSSELVRNPILQAFAYPSVLDSGLVHSLILQAFAYPSALGSRLVHIFLEHKVWRCCFDNYAIFSTSDQFMFGKLYQTIWHSLATLKTLINYILGPPALNYILVVGNALGPILGSPAVDNISNSTLSPILSPILGPILGPPAPGFILSSRLVCIFLEHKVCGAISIIFD